MINTCKTCLYRQELPIDPNNLQRMSVCKRFPPTPVLMPSGPQQLQIVPMFPIVADDVHCYEYKPMVPEPSTIPFIKGQKNDQPSPLPVLRRQRVA